MPYRRVSLAFAVAYWLIRCSHTSTLYADFTHSLYCYASIVNEPESAKIIKATSICQIVQWPRRERKFMTQLSMWLEAKKCSSGGNCSFNWKYFDKFAAFITLTPQAIHFFLSDWNQLKFMSELPLNFTWNTVA